MQHWLHHRLAQCGAHGTSEPAADRTANGRILTVLWAPQNPIQTLGSRGGLHSERFFVSGAGISISKSDALDFGLANRSTLPDFGASGSVATRRSASRRPCPALHRGVDTA